MSEKAPGEKKSTLSRLPGQFQDSSARERRLEIEDLSIPPAEFVKEFVLDDIKLESAERDAESYATASFVIERLWDYIKARKADGTADIVTRIDERKSEGTTTAEQFVFGMNATLDTYRDEFIDEFYTSLQGKPAEELSKSDALVLHYFNLKREENGGRIGMPSMKDLVTMIGRMGDLVPKVYERDLGRKATEEELWRTIEHPSTKRLFIEMMTNSRAILMPVLAKLEGQSDSNLDDYHRMLEPKFFKVQESENGSHVVFSPKAAKWFRDIFTLVAERQANERRTPPRALQCPALYTGKFIEMYDWVAGEFQDFSKRNRAD